MVGSPRGLSVFLALATAGSIGLFPSLAGACGGFFCNNLDPVVQTAERVLFRVEESGKITTIVEVQYQGPPSNFAWVIPVPESIDLDTVTVAPAGIFDELEAATAPVFTRPSARAWSRCPRHQWRGSCRRCRRRTLKWRPPVGTPSTRNSRRECLRSQTRSTMAWALPIVIGIRQPFRRRRRS
jgi:hypothetical protein